MKALEIISEMKHQRIQLGWSQRELAERAGVSRETINNMERGKYVPNLDTIIQIMEQLELSLTTEIRLV